MLIDHKMDKPVLDRRNRAIVDLMYYGEVKIGQLLTLNVADYDPERGVMRVGAKSVVELAGGSIAILDDWLETRGKLKVRASAPLFCAVEGSSRGRPLKAQNVRNMLRDRGRTLGIQKRVNPESIRVSRREHRMAEANRFERSVAEYVNTEGFRRAYPEAHRKWSDAHTLLETSPDRLATQIGHLCREAIQEFTDQLARQYKLGPFETNKTKNKIAAVFGAHEGASTTVKGAMTALAAYWDAVSDLVQKQEHGSEVAGEDSRRVVFLTMFVMREVSLALSR